MKELINYDWALNHTNYFLMSNIFTQNAGPSMYGYKRNTEAVFSSLHTIELMADFSYWFRDCVMTFDKEYLGRLASYDIKRVLDLNHRAGWIDILEEDDQTCTVKLNKEKIEKDLKAPGYFEGLYSARDNQGYLKEWEI